MTLRRLPTLLICLFPMAPAIRAAEEAAPKTSMKEVLRARIAEDAKKKPTPTSPAATTATPAGAPSAVAPTRTDDKPALAPPPKEANRTVADQPATVLPKVEVRKSRITELDQKLAKQEQDIARERKNLKSSEVDTVLNDAKVARPLAIFGGESTQFRKGVAAERIELMEAEKDLTEAIAHARTKEEKAALQKQLDELKKMRRDLEKTMR